MDPSRVDNATICKTSCRQWFLHGKCYNFDHFWRHQSRFLNGFIGPTVLGLSNRAWTIARFETGRCCATRGTCRSCPEGVLQPKFGVRISKFRISNSVGQPSFWGHLNGLFRLLKSINFVAQFRSLKSAKNVHHYVTNFKSYGGTLKAIIRRVKWGYIWGYNTLPQVVTFWPPSHLKNTRVNDFFA